MTNHILTNDDEITTRVESWSVIEVVDDGWTTIYQDEQLNQWRKFYIETEYHGGSQPVLLKLPEPTQEEIVECALNSSNENEIATLSALLFYNERDKGLDFRDLLITKLEKYISAPQFSSTEENQTKIKSIIYESSLYDETNLRPIDGKSIQQISEDHAYYKSLSTRAKQILNTTNNI